jgi:glutaredoxin-like YruB-family protein
MTQKSVTIYSTPSCHYCNLAKDFFKANDIAYTEINVAVDREKAKEMVAKTKQMGVPVIEIGSDITIIGFDEEKIRAALAV